MRGHSVNIQEGSLSKYAGGGCSLSRYTERSLCKNTGGGHSLDAQEKGHSLNAGGAVPH